MYNAVHSIAFVTELNTVLTGLSPPTPLTVCAYSTTPPAFALHGSRRLHSRRGRPLPEAPHQAANVTGAVHDEQVRRGRAAVDRRPDAIFRREQRPHERMHAIARTVRRRRTALLLSYHFANNISIHTHRRNTTKTITRD